MTEQLKIKLQNLPDAPGIYKMLDAKGRIIYIGKSKCLKRRVKSYFVPCPKWEKVKKMTPFIEDLEYIVTDTHLEAMLLECELIKQIKPYFNVLMKHDERYVYLKVEKKRTAPPFSILNQREAGEDCFGPFRSRNTLWELLERLRNLYPIIKEKRSFKFDYHIFPPAMDELSFEQNRTALLELCKKPSAMINFQKELEHKMKQAAEEYRFETAMTYRDLMQSFGYIKHSLSAYQNWMKNAVLADLDVKMLDEDKNIKHLHKLFFISRGQVVEKCLLEEVTEKARQDLTAIGKEKLLHMRSHGMEKSGIDYRDIIYAELSALPPERVEIIRK